MKLSLQFISKDDLHICVLNNTWLAKWDKVIISLLCCINAAISLIQSSLGPCNAWLCLLIMKDCFD